MSDNDPLNLPDDKIESTGPKPSVNRDTAISASKTPTSRNPNKTPHLEAPLSPSPSKITTPNIAASPTAAASPNGIQLTPPPSEVQKGGELLLEFRARLVTQTAQRMRDISAQAQADYQKHAPNIGEYLNSVLVSRRSVNDRLRNLELFGTQAGFQRPISGVKLCTTQGVLVSDWSGKLTLLDTEMQEKNSFITPHPISKLAVDHQAKLVGIGSNNSISILNENLEQKTTFSVPARICALEFHPTFLASSMGNQFRIYDMHTSKLVLTQNGHQNTINDLKPSLDTSLLLTTSSDHSSKIWDLRTVHPPLTFPGCAENTRCAWRPTRPHEFYVGGSDNKVVVYDARYNSQTVATLYAHTKSITGISLNQNNMATCGLDNKLRIWCLDTWRLLNEYPTAKPTCVDYVGSQIAVGKYDRTVDLYE